MLLVENLEKSQKDNKCKASFTAWHSASVLGPQLLFILTG